MPCPAGSAERRRGMGKVEIREHIVLIMQIPAKSAADKEMAYQRLAGAIQIVSYWRQSKLTSAHRDV